MARDQGINEGTLGNWVNADKRRRGEGDGALSESEREELARRQLHLQPRRPAGLGHHPGRGHFRYTYWPDHTRRTAAITAAPGPSYADDPAVGPVTAGYNRTTRPARSAMSMAPTGTSRH